MKIYAGHCASFNGDGKRDILARNRQTGELFVFPHSGALKGEETYGEPVLIGTGFDTFHRWIGAGDFTGNGYADVLSNTDEEKVYLYVNEGGLDGLETIAKEGIHIGGRLSPDISYDTLALGDLTGNGLTDCFGRLGGSVEVHSMLNQGLSGMDTFAEPKFLAKVGMYEIPFGVADITGNGRMDLLLDPINGDGELLAYDLYADGTDEQGEPVGPGKRYRISEGWTDKIMITVTDIDCDGRPDLLGLLPDGTLLAYVNQGFDPEHPLDTFAEPVVVATGWTQYDIIG